MQTGPSEVRRHDVVSVESGESGPRKSRFPDPGDRVAIRLHGHPHEYIVRVAKGPGGPKLSELTITSDTGLPVDYDTLRSVPAQRLAYAAAQWFDTSGGLFGDPGTTAETFTRPDLDARKRLDDNFLSEVADLVVRAVNNGHPVRKSVAAAMNTSPGTLDRWIRAAKDRGFLDEHDLPRHRRPETQS